VMAVGARCVISPDISHVSWIGNAPGPLESIVTSLDPGSTWACDSGGLPPGADRGGHRHQRW